jgi:hypothetical protein
MFTKVPSARTICGIRRLFVDRGQSEPQGSRGLGWACLRRDCAGRLRAPIPGIGRTAAGSLSEMLSEAEQAPSTAAASLVR